MASSFTFFLSVLVGLLLLQLALEVYGRGYRDNLAAEQCHGMLGETRSRLGTFSEDVDYQRECTPRGMQRDASAAIPEAGAPGVADPRPPPALSEAQAR